MSFDQPSCEPKPSTEKANDLEVALVELAFQMRDAAQLGGAHLGPIVVSALKSGTVSPQS